MKTVGRRAPLVQSNVDFVLNLLNKVTLKRDDPVGGPNQFLLQQKKALTSKTFLLCVEPSDKSTHSEKDLYCIVGLFDM